MILPNPDYQPPLARCRQHEATAHLRTTVLLLHRPGRSQAEDDLLLRSAWAGWECATLGGVMSSRITAGLLLAQTQLALGQAASAVRMAERVQRLARDTPQPLAATLRALMVGMQAWRALDQPDHAEHLADLARTLLDTSADPTERCHWQAQMDPAAVDQRSKRRSDVAAETAARGDGGDAAAALASSRAL